MIPVLALPSPSFHTTPAGGGCLTHVKFYVPQVHKHNGSSKESGFKPGALLLQSRDLPTRPSRPSNVKQALSFLLIFSKYLILYQCSINDYSRL
ncbi:hypothetical protein AVEN_63904-1 [Araneus ventricosus]|uniref:Uncharacterized protein n=1 Tax=Araneus ventricosus TaxID=182803 RepID=A0A4Y2GBQ2_ARAVE|nr:hypothetical protein AVEN_63904-1 [Araneus ventricosus]